MALIKPVNGVEPKFGKTATWQKTQQLLEML
jgi:hypothetical protein